MRFLIVILLSMLPTTRALAGDPTAHADAMTKAAKAVADLDKFKTGVGAPLIDGVPAQGMFEISTDAASENCRPYQESYVFPDTWSGGAACPYKTINGFAINEPDQWSCWDKRQPEVMTDVNSNFAMFQTGIAVGAHRATAEAGLACNWNHFVANPKLGLAQNGGTDDAFTHNRDVANEMIAKILADGGTATARCDQATFDRYYRRTANSLHYVQDAECEHHKDGNSICKDFDIVSTFGQFPIVSFSNARRCLGFLRDTVAEVEAGNYRCDEAVVKAGDQTKLNAKMAGVHAACRGVRAPSVTLATPRLSLACMGMERTLRHHCLLDVPKTLTCFGPPNDHTMPPGNAHETWCEGELEPGQGGEDFIAKAVAASVPPLTDAMDRWAVACKEPDDPCEPRQCDQWCQRSIGADRAGYCVNGVADLECVLHTCVCTAKDACGARGQPCCTTGPGCVGGDECSALTGTCVESGAGACTIDLELSPEGATIECPGTIALSVKSRNRQVGFGANPDWDFRFIWRTSGRHGTIKPPHTLDNDASNIYRCDDEDTRRGVDQVFVEVLRKRKSEPESAYVTLGSTRGEVNIENDPNIAIRHYDLTVMIHETVRNDGYDYWSALYLATIPAFPGAINYTATTYFDAPFLPLSWSESIRWNEGERVPEPLPLDLQPVDEHLVGGSYVWLVSATGCMGGPDGCNAAEAADWAATYETWQGHVEVRIEHE